MAEHNTATAKAPRYLVLDKYFRLPGPVTVPAKDGSKRKLSLQHRVGPDGGAWNLEELMEKTGLEKELLATTIKLERKFHNRKDFDRLFNITHKDYTTRLRAWIRIYKSYLVEFYASQGIRPVMNFVPDADPKHPVLYIQGFIDIETLTPVFGDLDDLTLAIEVKNAHLKSAVDEYRENQRIAKQAMNLPGVNKDLQNRLSQIVAGTVDRLLLLERFPKDDEGNAAGAAKKK